MRLRKTLLAAGLTLPLLALGATAQAGSPRAERTIQVPPGAVVLILPNAAAGFVAPAAPVVEQPIGFPAARIMAAQEAMLRRMTQQMRMLDRLTLAMPDPSQVIRAALGDAPMQRLAPSGGVVTTIISSGISSGRGVCREMITYRSTQPGAQPQVHVVRSGDACGALHGTAPTGVTEPMPRPAPAPEHGPRLWTIDFPPHAVSGGPPRT